MKWLDEKKKRIKNSFLNADDSILASYSASMVVVESTAYKRRRIGKQVSSMSVHRKDSIVYSWTAYIGGC